MSHGFFFIVLFCSFPWVLLILLINIGEVQIHGDGFPVGILYNVTLYHPPSTLAELNGLRVGT